MPFLLADVNLTEVAAVITALGGLLVGILAARRNTSQDKTTTQNALLEGYGQIVKDLQTEVARLRTQYTDDLSSWRSEKEILLKQIDILGNQLQPGPRKDLQLQPGSERNQLEK